MIVMTTLNAVADRMNILPLILVPLYTNIVREMDSRIINVDNNG